MFDVFKNRLEMMGTLTTVTALRISKGRSLEPTGSDLPVIKDALGKPLIPGSSFKGAMRSRLESFLRGIDERFAANPTIEAEWAITHERLNGSSGIKAQVKEALKRYPEAERAARQDRLLTQQMIDETDLASLIFGSPWIASKFQVRDLTVKPHTWFGQYQERDGVSIDRDTETAVDGRLYDFQVVPAGVQFDFRAVFENADSVKVQNPDTGNDEEIGYWELGLIIMGLQQFKLQQIPLGGGCSRGLGVVELDIDKVIWVDPEEEPAALLAYMKCLIQGDLSHYERDLDHLQALKEDWTNALINYLPWAQQHRVPNRVRA